MRPAAKPIDRNKPIGALAGAQRVSAGPNAGAGASASARPTTAGSARKPVAPAVGARPGTASKPAAATHTAGRPTTASGVRSGAAPALRASNGSGSGLSNTAVQQPSAAKPIAAVPAAVAAEVKHSQPPDWQRQSQPLNVQSQGQAQTKEPERSVASGSASDASASASANGSGSGSGSSVLSDPKGMDDMVFTELHRHSGVCVFSPNGKHIATTEKYQLFIRDAETLEIVQLYTCLDAISLVRWSPDSAYVMCAQFKRRVVQVWSVDDSDWTCKIDEGLAGLAYAWWSPDSRHILTATDFQLRLTIWSLVRRSVCYIKYPKFGDGRGVVFSHDNQYLAVVERRDFKDFVSVYLVGAGNPSTAQIAANAAHAAATGGAPAPVTASSGWSLIKSYPVDTEDLTDLQWSPDDRVICVYDSPLTYNIMVYTADGRKLAAYSAYDHMLGIKSVAFSKSSQFLSVGSYDECVRVFNHLTWKSLAEYKHTTAVSTDTTVVYVEQFLTGADGQPVTAAVAGAAGAAENKENFGPDQSRHVNLDHEDTDVSSEAGFRSKLEQLKSMSQGAASSMAAANASRAGSSTASSSNPNSSVMNKSVMSLAPSKRGVNVTGAKAADGKDMVLGAAPAATPAEYLPSQYVVAAPPSGVYEIPVVTRCDPDKPDPAMGVSTLEWSHDDRYLATRSDALPNTVWVWDTLRLCCVSVLQQTHAVRSVRWDPKAHRLAVCSGGNKLYLWSPDGCAIVDVMPGDFAVRSLRWNAHGDALILMSKDRFCVCHPPRS